MNSAFQNCPDVFKFNKRVDSVLDQKPLPFSCHSRLDPESSISGLDSRFRGNDDFGADVKKRWTFYTHFPSRGRLVAVLIAVIVLILAMSLLYGCTKENKDVAKLEEENRVLREKIASLESQIKPGVASRPQMKDELLVLARKLKTSPNEFVGQQIELHCRFGGFESKFLDNPNGPKFLSTYYVGLIAQSGKEIDEPLFDHLFMSKKEAKEQGVYRLRLNDLITIYGIVNNAYDKEPWIEVYIIQEGWK